MKQFVLCSEFARQFYKQRLKIFITCSEFGTMKVTTILFFFGVFGVIGLFAITATALYYIIRIYQTIKIAFQTPEQKEDIGYNRGVVYNLNDKI